jgi:hypothetical protein
MIKNSFPFLMFPPHPFFADWVLSMVGKFMKGDMKIEFDFKESFPNLLKNIFRDLFSGNAFPALQFPDVFVKYLKGLFLGDFSNPLGGLLMPEIGGGTGVKPNFDFTLTIFEGIGKKFFDFFGSAFYKPMIDGLIGKRSLFFDFLFEGDFSFKAFFAAYIPVLPLDATDCMNCIGKDIAIKLTRMWAGLESVKEHPTFEDGFYKSFTEKASNLRYSLSKCQDKCQTPSFSVTFTNYWIDIVTALAQFWKLFECDNEGWSCLLKFIAIDTDAFDTIFGRALKLLNKIKEYLSQMIGINPKPTPPTRDLHKFSLRFDLVISAFLAAKDYIFGLLQSLNIKGMLDWFSDFLKLPTIQFPTLPTINLPLPTFPEICDKSSPAGNWCAGPKFNVIKDLRNIADYIKKGWDVLLDLFKGASAPSLDKLLGILSAALQKLKEYFSGFELPRIPTPPGPTPPNPDVSIEFQLPDFVRKSFGSFYKGARFALDSILGIARRVGSLLSVFSGFGQLFDCKSCFSDVVISNLEKNILHPATKAVFPAFKAKVNAMTALFKTTYDSVHKSVMDFKTVLAAAFERVRGFEAPDVDSITAAANNIKATAEGIVAKDIAASFKTTREEVLAAFADLNKLKELGKVDINIEDFFPCINTKYVEITRGLIATVASVKGFVAALKEVFDKPPSSFSDFMDLLKSKLAPFFTQFSANIKLVLAGFSSKAENKAKETLTAFESVLADFVAAADASDAVLTESIALGKCMYSSVQLASTNLRTVVAHITGDQPMEASAFDAPIPKGGPGCPSDAFNAAMFTFSRALLGSSTAAVVATDAASTVSSGLAYSVTCLNSLVAAADAVADALAHFKAGYKEFRLLINEADWKKWPQHAEEIYKHIKRGVEILVEVFNLRSLSLPNSPALADFFNKIHNAAAALWNLLKSLFELKEKVMEIIGNLGSGSLGLAIGQVSDLFKSDAFSYLKDVFSSFKFEGSTGGFFSGAVLPKIFDCSAPLGSMLCGLRPPSLSLTLPSFEVPNIIDLIARPLRDFFFGLEGFGRFFGSISLPNGANPLQLVEKRVQHLWESFRDWLDLKLSELKGLKILDHLRGILIRPIALVFADLMSAFGELGVLIGHVFGTFSLPDFPMKARDLFLSLFGNLAGLVQEIISMLMLIFQNALSSVDYDIRGFHFLIQRLRGVLSDVNLDTFLSALGDIDITKYFPGGDLRKWFTIAKLTINLIPWELVDMLGNLLRKRSNTGKVYYKQFLLLLNQLSNKLKQYSWKELVDALNGMPFTGDLSLLLPGFNAMMGYFTTFGDGLTGHLGRLPSLLEYFNWMTGKEIQRDSCQIKINPEREMRPWEAKAGHYSKFCFHLE